MQSLLPGTALVYALPQKVKCGGITCPYSLGEEMLSSWFWALCSPDVSALGTRHKGQDKAFNMQGESAAIPTPMFVLEEVSSIQHSQ